MLLRLRTATIAAVTFFAGLAAGIASPVLALETDRTPLASHNLRTTQEVPAGPVAFAPRAEVVQPTAVPAVETAPVAVLNDAADAASYATLAAAVAAQPVAVDEDELNCLAVGVYYEAKGEPLAGQLAVAEVILNRAASGRFPPSVCGVLKQAGQFSFVRGGQIPDVDQGRSAWRTAVAVARVAVRDLWSSPVEGALFFHARHLSPRWNKAKLASIGNHVFYR